MSARCETCLGHGEVGGLTPDGYDGERCPSCAGHGVECEMCVACDGTGELVDVDSCGGDERCVCASCEGDGVAPIGGGS